ncbi:hypothetical protein [Yeosuana sp.]|uniref:hypothetical protein n=1 Tax=Yeosuana sp. TaxID=2529388 RepID=UPI004054F4EC
MITKLIMKLPMLFHTFCYTFNRDEPPQWPIKKHFRSYGYATIFCLDRTKNNVGLIQNYRLGLTLEELFRFKKHYYILLLFPFNIFYCFLLNKKNNMEQLFEKSYQKSMRTPMQFKRYLASQIDWNSRLIGIKGGRGAGKTTILLQYAKEPLPKGMVVTVFF